MKTEDQERILGEYLLRLAEDARRGDAREESFYPRFAAFLQACAEALGHEAHVTSIPRKTQDCLLDFQVWNGSRVAGYVEAKAPGTDLTAAAESEQLQRYRRTFPNLLLTDFREVWLFRNGALEVRTRIEPGVAELWVVLDRFFSFGGVSGPASARWLAAALAGRARVLSGCILELLREEERRGEVSRIGGLLQAFREYLRADLADGDFADLYAQTIAYGLLAARLREDGSHFDRQVVIEKIPQGSGILRNVFEALSFGSLPITIGWIVEDLVDLLAAAPIRDIVYRGFSHERGKDMVQHFYETFLVAYDKGLRKKRGVYYTPRPVVSFMVRSVHAHLRSCFGYPDGLADPRVVLLDPAAGTLTFLTEAFAVALEAYSKNHGPGGRAALIRDHLLPHFHAFELMMAPYTIGHWKARLFFEANCLPLADHQRVGLYLTNALETDDVVQTTFPWIAALARESHAAWRIKQEERVTVVIGNPPWYGRSANRQKKIGEDVMKAYGHVNGEPLRERNPKWLHDDYVKFIRFGQKKIEQNGEGILCFVTPHGYLDSPTFRGLRWSLQKTFDEMYFVDLHGNKRKRERGLRGDGDDNVFEGVAQGVAIAILIKKAGLPKRIFHAEVLGSRKNKFRWLDMDVEKDCWTELRPGASSPWIRAAQDGAEDDYNRGFPIPDIFPSRFVGVLTARDEVAIGFDREDLEDRIGKLHDLLAKGDDNPWRLDAVRVERVRRFLMDGSWRDLIRDVLYRPFDRRKILYADVLVDRPRREGMRPFLGGPNVGLVLPRQAREGMAAFVTDRMIAHKAVSAYDINSVFPLRRSPGGLFGGGAPNLGQPALDALGGAYGGKPSPEAVLHYVYAVLHSPQYRRKYAPFLRAGFPRIPFPANPALFLRLGALGAELVDLHLLRAERLRDSRVRCTGDGTVRLSRKRGWDRESGRVVVGGLCFEGIETEVWAYRIGGYQVLDRWLAARAGRRLTLQEIDDFRRAAAAVERTLEIRLQIEEIWPEVDEGEKVEK